VGIVRFKQYIPDVGLGEVIIMEDADWEFLLELFRQLGPRVDSTILDKKPISLNRNLDNEWVFKRYEIEENVVVILHIKTALQDELYRAKYNAIRAKIRKKARISHSKQNDLLPQNPEDINIIWD
jgi:hypothetical protein